MRSHIRVTIGVQRTIGAEREMIMQVCTEGFNIAISKFLNHFRCWVVVRSDMAAHGNVCFSR